MSLEESVKEIENLKALYLDLSKRMPVFVERGNEREYKASDLEFITEVISISQNFKSEALLKAWVSNYIKANNLEADAFVYLEGVEETKVRIGRIKNSQKPL